MAGKRAAVDVAGRRVFLTNLDKVLWPDDGYTKGDLIQYYLQMAPLMLPHLADRPLVMTRYPDGIRGKWFYQKDLPAHAPAWVDRWTYYAADAGRSIDFAIASEPATLVWAANLAAIELHPWHSRRGSPDTPDVAVFDLDPSPPALFQDCVEIAFLIRDTLARLGLRAYPKTSGATGLHIYLPIEPCYTYEQVATAVANLADLLHQLKPNETTRERLVKKRIGVYIDHLQNVKGKTIVGVYGVRPRPGAPVSTPVTWDELATCVPDQFTIRTVPERIASVGDLFAPVLTDRQPLDQLLST
ncbi:MAG: non-homologous end-joining DNA ligase [Chloroflexota bacterium]|jgi:bifunctional non-homologous end joining protein LigD